MHYSCWPFNQKTSATKLVNKTQTICSEEHFWPMIFSPRGLQEAQIWSIKNCSAEVVSCMRTVGWPCELWSTYHCHCICHNWIILKNTADFLNKQHSKLSSSWAHSFSQHVFFSVSDLYALTSVSQFPHLLLKLHYNVSNLPEYNWGRSREAKRERLGGQNNVQMACK